MSAEVLFLSSPISWCFQWTLSVSHRTSCMVYSGLLAGNLDLSHNVWLLLKSAWKSPRHCNSWILHIDIIHRWWQGLLQGWAVLCCLGPLLHWPVCSWPVWLSPVKGILVRQLPRELSVNMLPQRYSLLKWKSLKWVCSYYPKTCHLHNLANFYWILNT